MATIATAKAKLAAKIPAMRARYTRKMAAFLGVSEAQIANSGPVRAYGAKVAPGMENEWEKGIREAFGV